MLSIQPNRTQIEPIIKQRLVFIVLFTVSSIMVQAQDDCGSCVKGWHLGTAQRILPRLRHTQRKAILQEDCQTIMTRCTRCPLSFWKPKTRDAGNFRNGVFQCTLGYKIPFRWWATACWWCFSAIPCSCYSEMCCFDLPPLHQGGYRAHNEIKP